MSFDIIANQVNLNGCLKPLLEEEVPLKIRNRIYCKTLRRTFSNLTFKGYNYDESIVIKLYSEFQYWTLAIQKEETYRDFFIHISKFFLTLYIYAVIHITAYDELNINYLSCLLQSILGPETAEMNKLLRAKMLRDEISESKIPQLFFEKKIYNRFPMHNFDTEMNGYDSYLAEDFLVHWSCETDKFEHCLEKHEFDLNETLYRKSLIEILDLCIIVSPDQYQVNFEEVASRASNSKMIYSENGIFKK
jgi:hypothetical protein